MRHACGARAPFWRSDFVGFLLLTIFCGSPVSVFAQTVSSNCDNATAGDPIHCVIDGDEGETGDVSIDIENIDVTTTETSVAGIILNRYGNSGHVTIKVNGGEIDVTGNYRGIHSRLTADGKLLIDVQNVDITTNGIGADGVHARHQGAGDIVIRVHDGSITADGDPATGGVYAIQDGPGDGDVDVRITDVDIKTEDGGGVLAYQGGRGSGDIYILVTGGSITTGTNQETDPSADPTGRNSDHGVHGRFFNIGYPDLSGLVTIDVRDVDIVTNSLWANGIYGVQEISDDLVIRVQGGSIKTKSTALDSTNSLTYAHGIYAIHKGAVGDIDIYARNVDITTSGGSSVGIRAVREDVGVGNIRIDLQDISINTESTASVNEYGDTLADGILAYHKGSGDIDIDTERVVIETKGVFSRGIFASHEGAGSINLDIRGGSVKTAGEFAYGIYGLHTKTDHGGTISIRTGNGNDITTTGGNAHGIVAYNLGTLDTSSTAIDVEGDIHASGTDAQGVRVGSVNASNVVERVAAIGTDGYRKQTVTVNGSVTSAAEGVYLAGGGRVFIEPMGMIRSESGVAILATGDTPGENDGDPPIKPKLLVDMSLGGREVVEVIGDDWIINDGGETTILVNNVMLHDGTDGTTGLTAINGAWNVTMRAEGVTVDRDFSTQDFTETRRPPPPPSCPDGQVGTPPDCTDAETDTDTDTEMPLFMEEYAPRSAVYESLPGFLFRLRSHGPTTERLISPESPVWMAFSGGSGSADPRRSTTGAQYDYERYRVQLGKNLSLGEGLDGWFAVHYTQGDSEVSSPTGGGGIDAEGAGATFNIQWQHDSGYYLGGRASLTNYDIDLSSDDLGRLKSSVDALGVSLGFETGMRLAMGEILHLTPRAWLSHSSIDIDSFADAVGARASFPDEARLTGGIGTLAETLRDWKGGELTWHGSLDIEQRLNSRSTRVDVSGEKLKTETVSTRMLLGLGSLYRKGDFSISTQISADGLGTNDEEYSGQVKIGVRL